MKSKQHGFLVPTFTPSDVKHDKRELVDSLSDVIHVYKFLTADSHNVNKVTTTFNIELRMENTI